MKLSSLFLAGSLVANLILVGAMVVGRSADTDGKTSDDLAASVATAKQAPANATDALWTRVETADLTEFADHLRAQGFPPRTIRAIIAAQIRENFAGQRKALEGATTERPFWEPYTRDPKTQLALSALYREQEKQLRAVLGSEGEDESTRASLRRRFGNLPDEKLDVLRQIEEDYNAQRSEITLAARAGLITSYTDAENQKIKGLEKAFHDNLGSILSPQELEDYDLRNSTSAMRVRSSVTVFNPTEEEFRAIYRLQKEFDDRYATIGGSLSQEEARARSEAQKQLTADIKAALGAERGEFYERATNYDYRAASMLVTRLELPPQTTDQLWALQQEMQPRAQTLMRGGALSPAERIQQLAALNDEAKAKAAALLGARGFEAYQQNTSWLRSLQSMQQSLQSAQPSLEQGGVRR
jgi:hypothetical protein